MSPKSPFELPEIVSLIVANIRMHDVARCLRVCKTWHQMLLPYLWNDINTDRMSKFASAALYRHRHLIASVSFRNLQSENVFQYPILRQLSLHRTTSDNAKLLIKLNPMLDYLALTGFLDTDLTGFWEVAAEELTRLNYLSLTSTLLPVDQSDSVWKILTRLETLLLDNCILPARHNVMTVPSSGFPRLRRLIVELKSGEADPHQLDYILGYCPQLEVLTWVASGGNADVEHVARIAAQGKWPKLEDLSLSINTIVSDGSLALILRNMQQAVKLSIECVFFHLEAFEALRKHFSTLTVLDISRCPLVPSAGNQLILCSCPLLRTLKVNGVWAKDVVEGKPWVCQSLRVLEIRFLFNLGRKDMHRLIFERLSSLTHLEELRFHEYTSFLSYGPNESLDFRLKSGLGAIANLKRLKLVRLPNLTQQLETEEAEWMVENWKRLEVVVVIKTSAEIVFLSRGIKLRWG